MNTTMNFEFIVHNINLIFISDYHVKNSNSNDMLRWPRGILYTHCLLLTVVMRC